MIYSEICYIFEENFPTFTGFSTKYRKIGENTIEVSCYHCGQPQKFIFICTSPTVWSLQTYEYYNLLKEKSNE